MFDLNIKVKGHKDHEKRIQILKRCTELGYSCIAWTTSILGRIGAGTTTQLQPCKAFCLEPIHERDAMQLRRLVIDEGETYGNPVRQRSRLSVTIDDVMDAQSLTMGNEILNRFDIISGNPGNGKVFDFLCKTAEIDIISIDFTHKLQFSINKKSVDAAISRGICFEILYSPLLASSQTRREVFNGVKVLVQYLRGKHIILSSGADTLSQLRGPIDVAGIAQSLKLSKECALKSLSANCEMVLKHGCSRKLRYLPAQVASKSELLEKYPELMRLLPQGSTIGQAQLPQDSQTLLPEKQTSSVMQDMDNSSSSDEDTDEDIGKIGNRSNGESAVGAAVNHLTTKDDKFMIMTSKLLPSQRQQFNTTRLQAVTVTAHPTDYAGNTGSASAKHMGLSGCDISADDDKDDDDDDDDDDRDDHDDDEDEDDDIGLGEEGDQNGGGEDSHSGVGLGDIDFIQFDPLPTSSKPSKPSSGGVGICVGKTKAAAGDNANAAAALRMKVDGGRHENDSTGQSKSGKISEGKLSVSSDVGSAKHPAASKSLFSLHSRGVGSTAAAKPHKLNKLRAGVKSGGIKSGAFKVAKSGKTGKAGGKLLPSVSALVGAAVMSRLTPQGKGRSASAGGR